MWIAPHSKAHQDACTALGADVRAGAALLVVGGLVLRHHRELTQAAHKHPVRAALRLVRAEQLRGGAERGNAQQRRPTVFLQIIISIII